jgi:hypothetical protein
MNGAVHDAAIAAWNHKGYYDSSRPISFIRYMGQLGQSTDTSDFSYHPQGLPLEPGLVEIISTETTAPNERHEHLLGHEGKIAIRSWQGAIDGVAPFDDPSELSGAGWILAENWMPYQLTSFVTPPFAGYVSGHSTFSRAAAELLTRFTGDAYFPGGMAVFPAPKNEFLVFEDGPSVDVELEWAKYTDASDECSLSRIYGGIHPTQDDIPGRFMGAEIGPEALEYAAELFGESTGTDACVPSDTTICLNQGRFETEVTWKDFQGQVGNGTLIPYSSAVFLPTPLIFVIPDTSSSAISAAMSRGFDPDRIAIAVDGPTFFTVISASNSARSCRSMNPNNASLFSLACVKIRSVTRSPSAGSPFSV